jgi:hypothetical protein
MKASELLSLMNSAFMMTAILLALDVGYSDDFFWKNRELSSRFEV